jgi:hypothetical protein
LCVIHDRFEGKKKKVVKGKEEGGGACYQNQCVEKGWISEFITKTWEHQFTVILAIYTVFIKARL